MANAFTASVRKNPGRQFLVVEFRHPLRNDASGRPGKKIRKGLGTADRAEADSLVAELNQVLRDESLWSVGARPEASRRGFDPRVLEIFYAELEHFSRDAKALREQWLPLPGRESGYSRQLLIGVPGSGKTSLDRQLMGSHPRNDAFPPTSVNRTTTFPVETIFRSGEYAAVVTFLSEHEARFEIEESVSAAIIRAATDGIERTAKDFLDQSDMRFRLKYILGDYRFDETDDDDPYADPEQDELIEEEESDEEFRKDNQVKIERFVKRIWALAREYRDKVEKDLGSLDGMDANDRSAALDILQAEAETTDEYAAVVSDILEELRERFNAVSAGRFERNTTSWPRLWRLDTNDRKEFFVALRFFAGIAATRWGRLLTPLVNGIRVVGPFQPIWATSIPKLVVFDTEGLGHKADASADLPDYLISMFNDVDNIVLVHSAKSAMDFSVGKALEALVSAGQTKKTIIVFTHMDVVQGPNLRGGRAKREHAFNNLRNVVENQLAKSIPSQVIRLVTDHLESNVFYLGKINEATPSGAYSDLRLLTTRLENASPRPPIVVGFPHYNTDHLVLSIREAAEAFRLPWRARLGLDIHPQEVPLPWQSVKAMTRRYAEGFDDGYYLRPASNLLNNLSVAVSRFLETPTSWDGDLSNDDKRSIIDHIKAECTNNLLALSSRRLREQPQPQWQSAYAYRGVGSTVSRRNTVESIYARWVPIPTSVGDVDAEAFLDDVKSKVVEAIDNVRRDVEDRRALSTEQTTRERASAAVNYACLPFYVGADPISGFGRWKNHLGDTIARAFGCKYVVRADIVGKAANVIIIGEPANAEAAQKMFQLIENPKGAAYVAYCAALRAAKGPNVDVNGHDYPWGVSFLLGYCEAVRELFADRIELHRQTVLDISERFPDFNAPLPTHTKIDDATRQLGYAWGKKLTQDDVLRATETNAKEAKTKTA